MKQLVIAASSTLLIYAGCAYAGIATGDPAAGKQIAEKVCAACHGADGNSTSPDFPRLAGQHPDYLVKALSDYKSGARKNPIMAPMAASLSHEDMLNVAAYFASQKGLYTKY